MTLPTGKEELGLGNGFTILEPFAMWGQIIGANGHFHSRGKSFVVGHWDPVNRTLRDTIYSNQTWDEPPVTPVVPTLAVRPGDSLAYVCSYENRTDNEIKFGDARKAWFPDVFARRNGRCHGL